MTKKYISQTLREKVAKAAHYRCGYCLTTELVVGTPMEIDHLLPEALGGETEETNLWLACSLCNDYKSKKVAARDPNTGKIEPLYNPRLQIWNDHFVWVKAGTEISGKTPSGRATIVALKLNRETLIRSRRLWVQSGWHPPKD